MDRFIIDLNIQRYLRLLGEVTDPEERRILKHLLETERQLLAPGDGSSTNPR